MLFSRGYSPVTVGAGNFKEAWFIGIFEAYGSAVGLTGFVDEKFVIIISIAVKSLDRVMRFVGGTEEEP